jgi:drug/metabolite transporter (DMT)-like permease
MEISSKKNINYGFIAIAIWCVLTAFGYVYTNSIEQDVPIALMCFILFGFSTLVFNLMNYKSLRILLKKSGRHFRTILNVNIATFGGWLLLVYAIKYIEPSVANTMILASLPIYTLLINKYNQHHLAMNKKNNFTAILLGAGVLYLILLLLTGNTVSLGSSFGEILVAIGVSLVSGLFLAFNNINVKKLSDATFTPLDILCLRFVSCAVATGIFAVFSGEVYAITKLATVEPVFLNAFILVIIPQIAIQISLRELEPFTVSIIMPFMPVLMFIMEFFTKRLQPTAAVYVGIIAICMVSLSGSIFRYRAEKISGTLVAST